MWYMLRIFKGEIEMWLTGKMTGTCNVVQRQLS